MVFKSIEKIKDALPEVFHVIMFYDNGTVFQSTFEQDFNIPKMGENISETLTHLRRLYELCNFEPIDYKKMIFETRRVSLIVIKLGEESNLALFFEKQKDIEVQLKSIRHYIKKIEKLVDMEKE